jgi:hypothetical protein
VKRQARATENVDDDDDESAGVTPSTAGTTAAQARLAPGRCETLEDVGVMVYPRRVFRPAGPRPPPASWGPLPLPTKSGGMLVM